jgi:cytidylate kinase
MKTTPERLGEALQRARGQWRHRKSEPPTLPPATRKLAFTIAVSRESGAGGASVARELGSRLDWPVYDRELLELISEQSGLQKELLESLEERETSRAAEWLESLFVPKTVTRIQFAHRLVKTLSALAARGDCIIVGRGATVILPESTTLRVRLVAPRKTRIARIQSKSGLPERSVGLRIDEIDSLRAEFIRSQFHKDVVDVHHYDLVINTDRFSVSSSADLIITALKQLEEGQRQNTPSDHCHVIG